MSPPEEDTESIVRRLRGFQAGVNVRQAAVTMVALLCIVGMVGGYVSIANDPASPIGQVQAQSQDGDVVYTGNQYSEVKALDATDGSTIWTSGAVPAVIRSVTRSADGDVVYAGNNEGILKALNSTDGSAIWTYQGHSNTINGISSSPNSERVYSASADGTLKALNADDGSEIWNFSGHSGGLFGVSTSADGQVVYTASSDNTVKAIDASDGSEIWTFNGHTGSVRDVSATPSVVYSSSDDGTVRAIDASDGTEMWVFDGHTDDVRSVSASPDGRTVFSGGYDNTVRAIDAADGTQLWAYSGHSDRLTSVSSSPDGDAVYSGADDQTARAINATDGSELWSVTQSSRVRTVDGGGTSWGASVFSDIEGEVTDQDGNAIENATVKTTSGGRDITSTTDQYGQYELTVGNGTYNVTASKSGYFPQSETVQVDGQDVTQDFQLRNFSAALSIETRPFLEHGEKAPYAVVYESSSGSSGRLTREDVTDNATVTSGDTDVVTVDQFNREIVATSDMSVNNRTYIEAEYSLGEETYTARQNVTVANETVDNLAILPPVQRFTASLSGGTDANPNDRTIMLLIIGAAAGAAASLIATSFAGVAALTMTMMLGWIMGMLGNGMAIVTIFIALFVGLNVAGNVDYTVRR